MSEGNARADPEISGAVFTKTIKISNLAQVCGFRHILKLLGLALPLEQPARIERDNPDVAVSVLVKTKRVVTKQAVAWSVDGLRFDQSQVFQSFDLRKTNHQ